MTEIFSQKEDVVGWLLLVLVLILVLISFFVIVVLVLLSLVPLIFLLLLLLLLLPLYEQIFKGTESSLKAHIITYCIQYVIKYRCL